MRMNKVPISWAIVKEKALSHLQELQAEKFHVLIKWFERQKAIFKVSFKAIAGEEKAVIPEMTSSWLETHLPKFYHDLNSKNSIMLSSIIYKSIEK